VRGAAILLRDASGEHRAVIAPDGTVVVNGSAIVAGGYGSGVIRLGEDPIRTAWAAAAGDIRWVFLDGEVYEFEVFREGAARRRGAGSHGSLAAPMPGTVIRIRVGPGDIVKRGDTVIILEAMKMELPVRAPDDGRISAVLCREGDLVQAGVPLIELEAGD
jgi:biotin carboxyl carrier protein